MATTVNGGQALGAFSGTTATLTGLVLSGKDTNYNNIATAGIGVVPVYGSTLNKAETNSADANVLTYTPPAAAGLYRVTVVANVKTATSGVVGFTVAYTDSAGNAVAATAVSLTQLGTAAPALTYTVSAAGRYYGTIDIAINNGAANIIVAWVGGGTSTADVSAIVEQLA